MPNRLAAEKSPYLRQHADNPVAWLPWGEEALARARAEQKPIFLSIGYSTCHWCHVMAHESFEDATVAAVLNRDFIPVKVDREERPDLDRIYMTYVQHTTGHGGWPMSVWLTPKGEPFYGGTYFPREDRHGRPGFVTLLETIAGHWRDQRPKIEQGAAGVVEALAHNAREGAGPAGDTPLHEAAGEAFEKAFQYFYDAHDTRWGGFGGAPKFPRGSILEFLFRTAALQGANSDLGQAAIGLCAVTLQRMAEGGLHDHLGGGFHRYAVDAEWHVPHFEKMLYDQALIALNCLEAQQATALPVFGWVARGIFDYVARDLTHPAGGFYSAEDADSTAESGAHAEGAFYVWTQKEIEAELGADAPFFCAHFDVKPEGNVAHDPHGEFPGKNVLRQLRPLVRTAEQFKLTPVDAEAKLLGCVEKLRLARERRPRPHRDDKIVTAWNGLMISALARGHQVLGHEAGEGRDGPPGRPEETARPAVAPYLHAATRAAEFLQHELYDAATGELYRTWREGRSAITGFAEDYASLIQGLLDLYEAGFDIRWLQWAERLQRRMDELFWDAEHGGYFNTRAGDPAVILRLKDDYDGAEPAANSIAALNLLRLDWMIGTEDSYRTKALRTLEAFRSQWSRSPHALPQMLSALELALAEPRTVVLAGDPAAADFRALAATLATGLGPRRAILAADGGPGQAWLAARRPYLADMRPAGGRATAYVCENFTCHAPITDAPQLQQRLFPQA
jgi:uncharacterized protein YyaL (SSP411 family)